MLILTHQSSNFISFFDGLQKSDRLVCKLVERLVLKLWQHSFLVGIEEKASDLMIKLDGVQYMLRLGDVKEV